VSMEFSIFVDFICVNFQREAAQCGAMDVSDQGSSLDGGIRTACGHARIKGAASKGNEPPRACRRPQRLRGYDDDSPETRAILSGGPRAGAASGAAAPGRARLGVGGDQLDRGKDRLHSGDVARLAAAGRA
jgi:hypothetical protein